jgi:hypothetical protein
MSRDIFAASPGFHLYRHADIRHIGKRETEEHVDVDVWFAGFPNQRPLHQIHPW